MVENRTIKTAQLKVGMEIHVELSTRSKMFSRSANVAHPDHYDATPNTLVDPVVLGLPGALPVMNRAAIESSIMVGLALNCSIAEFSRWDRKNYFYPDLPKGYQISQYDLPLCFDGELEFIGANGQPQTVSIIRAHLEEDTGKLSHDISCRHGSMHVNALNQSLIDLNRAGTPLLEIVTHPDLKYADDAVIFCQELRNVCRFLNVTGGIMQRGHMRFEPNVNVIITTDEGKQIATPIVEVKNLNSFKAVKGAIEHEFNRQIKQWQETGLEMGAGMKSTRGWDADRGVTVLQREKEDAHDYRYFPDPDLPPVVVTEEWKQSIATCIPELPQQRRRRYVDEYNLTDADALTLTTDFDVSNYFESCIDMLQQRTTSDMTAAHMGKTVAKLLLNAGARRANEHHRELHDLGVTPEQIAQLIEMREANTIGSSAADELFDLLCEHDADATTLAESCGLLQVTDSAQLDSWIAQALEAEPEAAANYAGGKDNALGRIIGTIMKLSNGKADAKSASDQIRRQLRDN